jgi:hypothetical protein
LKGIAGVMRDRTEWVYPDSCESMNKGIRQGSSCAYAHARARNHAFVRHVAAKEGMAKRGPSPRCSTQDSRVRGGVHACARVGVTVSEAKRSKSVPSATCIFKRANSLPANVLAPTDLQLCACESVLRGACARVCVGRCVCTGPCAGACLQARVRSHSRLRSRLHV